LRRRWQDHRRHLKQGIHHGRYLQRSWNKYGPGAFEFRVIGTCPPDALLRMEQHLLNDLHPEYNNSPTAGSALGVKHMPETRAKMSAVQIGKKLSPATRAKISAAHLGKKLSPEHCAKLSAARLGKNRPPFTPKTLAKMSEAQLGKKHTPETRAKISAAKKGKPWSPARRAASHRN